MSLEINMQKRIKKNKKIKAIKESQRPSSDYKSLSVSIVELAESV